MKPFLFLRRRAALPVSIVIAFAAPLAPAAIHSFSGDYTVAPGTHAADTLYADDDNSNTPHLITIPAGATLTGDPAWERPVQVFDGTFTVRNNGTLHGSEEGVLFWGRGTLDNGVTGIIRGDTDNGARMGNSSTTNNRGEISSVLGDGFKGGYGLTLNNWGRISGGVNGVHVDGRVELTNHAGSTIIGDISGVTAGNGTIINNTGNIQGAYGLYLLPNGSANVEIHNQGTILGTSMIASGIEHWLGSFDLENSGIIMSRDEFGNIGTAIRTRSHDSRITLHAGSIVIGDISARETTTLDLTGGLEYGGALTNVVQGSISSLASIVKSGTGTAFLGRMDGSDNFECSDIQLQSGGLFLNGYLEGYQIGPVSINSDGTHLGGSGYWFSATVDVNFGSLSAGGTSIELAADPTDAVGELEILGQVNQASGTFLTWDVISGTAIRNGINSDLIVQRGQGNESTHTFAAGTSLNISSTNPDALITAGTYTIIQGTGGVTGLPELGVLVSLNAPDTGVTSSAWSQLLALHDLNPAIHSLQFTDTLLTQRFARAYVDGADLKLDVQYDFAGLPGLSETEALIGSALDQLANSGDAAASDLISALALSDEATAKDALYAIGQPLDAAVLTYTTAILDTNRRIDTQVRDHLASARGNNDVVSIPVGLSSKDAVESPGSAPRQRGNVWGAVSFDHHDVEGGGPAPDTDGDTGAFTAGADYRVAESLILGGLVDGSESDYHNGPDIESLRLAAYGSWGRSTGTYADFIIGLGDHDLDLTDAWSFQALAAIGHTFRNGGLRHGPFAGLEYQYLETDDFDAGLTTVDEVKADSLRGLIGYRADYTIGRFQPYLSVSYAHEFREDGPRAIADLLGADFRFRGGEQGSAILITAGTGIALTRDLSMGIGYRGEIGTDSHSTDSHGGSLSLNWRF